MAYFKHFLGFIGIFLITILLLPSADKIAANNQSTAKDLKNSAQILENYYSEKLTNLGINLHPGSEHRKDSNPTPETGTRCKSLVYRALLKLPLSHRNQLSSLTLFYTQNGRRGLGGNGSVILRCLNVNDSELIAVFMHEMGHLVDEGYLYGTNDENESEFYDFQTPILEDDESVIFYRLSWKNEKKRRGNSTSWDFVSIYAKTDPFEDFAETYTYYRLHGAEFRQLTVSSQALAKKYEFMKKYVFEGKEFGKSSNESVSGINIWQRNYDVTVLPYNDSEA